MTRSSTGMASTGRDGWIRALQSASSARRLPTPAMNDRSRRTALIRPRRVSRSRRNPARPTSRASGPNRARRPSTSSRSPASHTPPNFRMFRSGSPRRSKATITRSGGCRSRGVGRPQDVPVIPKCSTRAGPSGPGDHPLPPALRILESMASERLVELRRGHVTQDPGVGHDHFGHAATRGATGERPSEVLDVRRSRPAAVTARRAGCGSSGCPGSSRCPRWSYPPPPAGVGNPGSS